MNLRNLAYTFFAKSINKQHLNIQNEMFLLREDKKNWTNRGICLIKCSLLESLLYL